MALLDANTIKFEMRGQWADFFGRTFSEMQDVLKRKLGSPCPCPVHGGKDGFRLFKDFNETGGAYSQKDGAKATGVDLAAWLIQEGGSQLSGANVGEALRLLSLYIDPDGKMALEEFRNNRPIKKFVVEEPKYDPEQAKKLKKTMNFSKLVKSDNSFVIKYLQGRYLNINSQNISPVLRANNSLLYYDNETEEVSYHPGMIALMTDMKYQSNEMPYGKPITLHRTYLTKDGQKADVTDVKKTMSSAEPTMSGSACWLDLPYVYNDKGDAYMAISEGIETALAVKELTGSPSVVAAINATLLELINIPSNVKWVDIYADHDYFKQGERRGERSALVLKERLESMGITVRIVMPPLEGMDWLDVLQVVKTSIYPGQEDLETANRAISTLPNKAKKYAIQQFGLAA